MMNFDNITALGESGTLVKDMSQYANNGSISGATWTGNGKRGGAYSFDGNDIIQLLYSGTDITTDNFTISIRAKF